MDVTSFVGGVKISGNGGTYLHPSITPAWARARAKALAIFCHATVGASEAKNEHARIRLGRPIEARLTSHIPMLSYK